ncbi:MAG: 4Fe-4S double cluster binding domain-containing protein [Candidatus Hodarchaeales archaeon]
MKRIIFKFMEKLQLGSIFALEQELAERSDTVKAHPTSPERGLLNPNSDKKFTPPMGLRKIPTMMRIVRPMFGNMRRSLETIDENPQQPKTEVDKSFLAGFEEKARSLGVGAIGYAKLPREYIFADKAVLYDNVIVLSMEMDYDKMELAPSHQTHVMILDTYNDLGIVSNKLTEHLREQGYAAQAGHPLGGLSLYPPSGQLAGMGWHGINGLLIIPEFGPRHRLTVIYTSMTNLPVTEQNDHRWIEDYCKQCKRCIKACPGQAIYESPITNENGLKTHIDTDKCFPEFSNNHGCSVCIKICPFNRNSYTEIKKEFNGSSK